MVDQHYTATSIIREFCSWRLSIKIGRLLIIALSIALFINLCIHDRDLKGEKWIKAFSLCVFGYLLTLCHPLLFGEMRFYLTLSVILSVHVVYLLKNVQNYNTQEKFFINRHGFVLLLFKYLACYLWKQFHVVKKVSKLYFI